MDCFLSTNLIREADFQTSNNILLFLLETKRMLCWKGTTRWMPLEWYLSTKGKWNKVNRHLNKFRWIFQLVLATNLILKIRQKKDKKDKGWFISCSLEGASVVLAISTKSLSELIRTYQNLSELIQLFFYFISLKN